MIHVAHSIYVHRGIGHGLFTFSKSLDRFFRVVLWLGGRLGPNWAETYASRHRKHHHYSDTELDPHSPYHKTLKELLKPWHAKQEDIDRFCPEVKTPEDWIQKVLVEKYRKFGPWVISIVAGVLYGWQGFLISTFIEQVIANWVGIFLGTYALHKYGFTYAGNKGADKSRNHFPIGIYFGGEELHANHHNDRWCANLRHFWFEVDIGYLYAILLEKLGLLTITGKQ